MFQEINNIMTNQFEIRDPNYLKSWKVFQDERSARDIISILNNELNSLIVFEERTKMLDSLKDKLSKEGKGVFLKFLEEERKKLNLKWSSKTENFNFPKGGTILDLMCGTGKAGNLVYHHLDSIGKNPKLIYADFSDKMLENIEDPVENSSKMKIDARNMTQFESNSIDLIICRYGFNNLDEKDWKKNIGRSFKSFSSKWAFHNSRSFRSRRIFFFAW